MIDEEKEIVVDSHLEDISIQYDVSFYGSEGVIFDEAVLTSTGNLCVEPNLEKKKSITLFPFTKRVFSGCLFLGLVNAMIHCHHWLNHATCATKKTDKKFLDQALRL